MQRLDGTAFCHCFGTRGVLWCAHLVRAREEAAYLYNKSHGLAYVASLRLQLIHAATIIAAVITNLGDLAHAPVRVLVYFLATLACFAGPCLEARAIESGAPRSVLLLISAISMMVQALGPTLGTSLQMGVYDGVALDWDDPTRNLVMILTGLGIGSGAILRVLAFNVWVFEGEALALVTIASAFNSVSVLTLSKASAPQGIDNSFFYGLNFVHHFAAAILGILLARTSRWSFAVSWRSARRGALAVPAVPFWFVRGGAVPRGFVSLDPGRAASVRSVEPRGGEAVESATLDDGSTNYSSGGPLAAQSAHILSSMAASDDSDDNGAPNGIYFEGSRAPGTPPSTRSPAPRVSTMTALA
ncbi:hypothetical protein FNF28_03501 [Cafeteria roenbergensis]|uniref:Uncharacterized protein n=1 Tax=Cafeteria roenbergensis TaxID=33653 RepID=A0A5A8DML6_CAFRO|nr:hypothetical protein FNF28_03501 [Cafeteria roenbergensis]